MQTGPYSTPSIAAYLPPTRELLTTAVYQTADVTNSSNTTPTDVTGLAFTLASGVRYFFKFVVQGRSAANTTGLGFCFSAPAMTFSHFKIKNQQGNAGTDQYYENSQDDDLTAVLVNASVIAQDTDYIFIIEGICQPSANGTLQLRCRSEVNTSQITVKNGIGFLIDTSVGASVGLPDLTTAGYHLAINSGKTNAEWVPNRELLTADLTVYVRTDGSDSSARNGRTNSSGSAFATPQYAYDRITSDLDFGGKNVTVQVGDGTYGKITLGLPWTGGGTLTISGNVTTPSNVIIDGDGSTTILVTATLPGRLYVKGFKLDDAGSCLQLDGIGLIEVSKLDFGDCSNSHIAATANGATIYIVDDYSITGDALVHYAAYLGAIWLEAGNDITITLTGTPAIDYFADAENAGTILAYSYGVTYSGSATGMRYYVDSLGGIATGGGGANFFPGNVAGELYEGYYG